MRGPKLMLSNTIERGVMRCVRGLLLVGLVAWVSSTASAGDLRHAALIDEVVDGAASTSIGTEVAIINALKKRGITFVDASQSQKVRSVTDAGTLIAGTVPDVVTALDADVLIAAVCRMEQIKNELIAGTAVRYSAAVDAKLIRVDTGQVVGAYQVLGKGLGFSKAQAQQKAAQDAGKKLAEEIAAASSGAAVDASSLELTVQGIPNVSAGEAVVRGLERVKGIKGVRALQMGRGAAKLRLTVSAGARETAVAIDGASGLGLSVFGYSRSAIKAEYRAETATRFPIVITRFSGGRKAGWRGDAMGKIVGASLSNTGFVDIVNSDKPARLGRKKSRLKKVLKGLKTDATNALVLEGALHRGGGKESVVISLSSAATGAVIATAQRPCTGELASCVAAAGDELSDGLMGNLLKKRHLFKDALPARAQVASKASGSDAKPLRVLSLDVDNVYPARLNAYRDQPLGMINVVNTSSEPLQDVVVEAKLAGFAAPVESKSTQIAAKGKATLPIKVVLDPATLRDHDENQTAILTLVIRYRVGEFQVEQRRTRAVMVFDRNTVNWSTPGSVASFVTSRSSSVARLSRDIQGALPPSAASDPVALGAAVFAGMQELGLRYQRDPVNPYGAEVLDTVQFPEQTLTNNTGDCDDLAVLYASLAESLGVPAALVLTPEHVFVATYTGVPSQSGDRLLNHRGMAWLPLETTLLNKSVDAAWDRAAEQVAAHGDALRVIEVRSAWSEHPPAALAAAGANGFRYDAKALRGSVSAAVKSIGAKRRGRLSDDVARIDALLKDQGDKPQLRLQKGYLLARAGDFAAAQAEFDRLTNARAWSAFAVNNNGNVHLLDGRPAVARKQYLAALKLRQGDARIHANAAIASHLLGDASAFDDHLFECIANGGDALVAQISRSGLGGAGARGSAAGRSSLGQAIRDAYKRRNVSLPNGLAVGGRRATSAESTVTLAAEQLQWLWE